MPTNIFADAVARQHKPSNPTVLRSDPRYFDLTWFPTPDPGQHPLAARLEQVAAIDRRKADDRRARKARPHGAAAWPSAGSTIGNGPLRDHFAALLPPRPYCSNDVKTEGVRVRPRATALRYRLLQLNGPNVVTWLRFDIDRGDAFFAAEDGNVPLPNFIAVNVADSKRFGHAHAGYLLARPIHRFSASRTKPREFGSAVERGLCRRLGADPCYTGLLTKNPMMTSAWRVTWLRDEPYSLAELAGSLFPRDMRRWPRHLATGLSRDCDCFDRTRRWAYKHVLGFRRAGATHAQWIAQFIEVATEHNQVFRDPLGPAQARKIGKGVGGWTWQRFTDEGFSRRQASCGRRGMAKRWAGHVSAEKTRPWEAEGISRATWYRRRGAAGTRRWSAKRARWPRGNHKVIEAEMAVRQ